MTGPELNHGALSRAELRQAARQAAALSVQSRGELATAWRALADALAELADARDPAHGADSIRTPARGGGPGHITVTRE